MKVFRLLTLALLVALSTSVAIADGTSGDPVGSIHSPAGGGTPPAGLNFSLPPFGTPVGPNPGPCEFVVASQTEFCIFQNESGQTWSSITLQTTAATPCADIQLSTNLFTTFSCVNDSVGAALIFSGINSSESNPSGIGTAAICSPAAGVFPGVLAGCDFEINLGPSVDPGNWPMGMTTNATANPEPSTLVLMMTGLAGLVFLVVRRG